ncbi:hypothetical protein BH23BAC2_BH23BAC2_11150 [soil metagenome]
MQNIGPSKKEEYLFSTSGYFKISYLRYLLIKILKDITPRQGSDFVTLLVSIPLHGMLAYYAPSGLGI